MIEQYYAKLFRGMIDPDGSTPREQIAQIAAGKLSGELFSDFDAKTNTFGSSDWSDLFDFAVDYYNQYGQLITTDIVRSEVMNDSELKPAHKKRLIEIINQIANEDYVPSEFEFLCSKVQEHYVANYSVHIYKNGLAQAQESSSLDALEYVQRSITDLKARVSPSRNKLDESMLLWQFAEHKLAEFLDTGQVIKPIAKFGFPKWDAAFGGVFAEEVTILAGPKNSFKSGLMNRIIIHNIFQGKRVVWATKENSVTQNWNRLLAYMTGIPLTKINLGLFTDLERQVFIQAQQELISRKDQVLLVTPKDCGTILMLKQQIQRAFGDNNPDIVGLDHIGRLKPSNRIYGQSWENMQAVTEETKDFVSYFQTHVISPAHLNRKGNKSGIDETSLDDVQFDSISQIVDTMFICKPDTDRPWLPPDPGDYFGKPGILNCKVERARQAPKGMVFQLEVEPSICLARDWNEPPPTSAEAPEAIKEIRRAKMRRKNEEE